MNKGYGALFALIVVGFFWHPVIATVVSIVAIIYYRMTYESPQQATKRIRDRIKQEYGVDLDK